MNIWNILILMGIFIFLIAGIIIFSEIFEVYSFCKENNESFSLKFSKDVKYYCDGKEIGRYSDGWTYNRDLLTNLTIDLSRN